MTCLVPRRLSLNDNVPFPWSLAVHHQSQASTLPKTKFTMVLQWFYNGFTMVLQWFYSGFTVVLKGLVLK